MADLSSTGVGGAVVEQLRAGPALFVVLAFVTLIAALFAAPVRASEGYETAEECIQSRPLEVPVMDWSCSKVSGGKWKPAVASDGGIPGFGGFLVFAVLWALVPLAIAVALASQRGESAGAAVALTLFFGWVGLAIVYFGQRKTRDAVEGLAARAAASPREPVAPPHPPAAEQPEDRLRRLERMREEGLLTDDEYEVQRGRILDSL